MPTRDLGDCDPRILARLMDGETIGGRVFGGEELAALAREELSAPVDFDLAGIDSAQARELESPSVGNEPLPKCFEDLFSHPSPPVELLELCRRFGKAYLIHPRGPLPLEIAALLYFASIAVALVRCGRRITSLDNASLARAFQWFGNQSWVDQRQREVFADGLDLLRSGGELPT